MVNELIKATGELEITVYNSNNEIKEQVVVPNMVVTSGKEAIADRLIDTSTAVMSHMAIGTDNGTILPLAASNTNLGNIAGSRITFSGSPSRTGAVVTYSATFGPGVSTGAITEAGIFNASTGGDMLCRTIFPVVNKEAGDSMTINWNVTIN